MKYKAITLGCKVNQYETQALETMLEQRGHTAAKSEEAADAVIINTCAVTAESGRKSRQAIRRIAAENPGAIVAVCGCFSQLSPGEVQELGADVVHGSGEKAAFLRDIEQAVGKKEKSCITDDPFSRRLFEELPSGAVDGRTRAMLKIQDGCVNFCTYCIIPYTRGRLRSLPPERCAAQTAELVEQGFREMVITGIEIASYGRDLPGKYTLTDAVEAIAAAAGDMRLRLGSLEPTVITEDFCKRLAATGRVCDHFHLSLQSGCDETLRRMNRKYDTAQFYEAAQRLRRYFPDCGLTADLIVGFPGETEQQHEETLEFIKKVGFSAMHIFPYSKRPGTKAAEFSPQLTGKIKSERASQAQKVADDMEKTYLESCVGKTFSVLFESDRGQVSVGHAANYAQVCVIDGRLHGIVKCVQITGVSGKMLVGLLI